MLINFKWLLFIGWRVEADFRARLARDASTETTTLSMLADWEFILVYIHIHTYMHVLMLVFLSAVCGTLARHLQVCNIIMDIMLKVHCQHASTSKVTWTRTLLNSHTHMHTSTHSYTHSHTHIHAHAVWHFLVDIIVCASWTKIESDSIAVALPCLGLFRANKIWIYGLFAWLFATERQCNNLERGRPRSSCEQSNSQLSPMQSYFKAKNLASLMSLCTHTHNPRVEQPNI